MNPLCQCGCGFQVVLPKSKWCWGHHNQKGKTALTLVNHELVKEMLSKGVPHAEVARSVGCSRERIRQLDLKYFGITGRERQHGRIFARRASVESMLPVHPFISEATSRGLTIESSGSKSGVFVNGKLCLLRKSAHHGCGNRSGRIYHVIRHIRIPADFYIHQISSSQFFIIPGHAQPVGDTSIALDPIKNRGAHAFRHDYIKYLNAWDLLGDQQ